VTRHGPPKRANQHHKSAESRDEPALEAARRAHADQSTQKHAEIEASRVDQQPLPDVGVPAQVHTPHAASLIEMSKWPFQALTAEPKQAQTAHATNAATIAIDRVAGPRVGFPVPSSSIGFGDVAADADGFEIDERLIAVIALVGDDFFDALPSGRTVSTCSAASMSVSILVVVSPSSAFCTVTPTIAPLSRSTARSPSTQTVTG
jgi:hypothetical protein